MTYNTDGIREKNISCLSGKRHSNKDRLQQLKGDIIHDDRDKDGLNEDDYDCETMDGRLWN